MKTRTLLLFVLTLALALTVSAFAFAASGEESECPLEQLQGASVRLDENHSGLRFESRIPTDALAELGDVTIGTLIFPTDRLTGELTVETAGALNLVGARPIEKNDGYTYFYAAIVDILPQNYTRDFTAVSYVKSGESYSYTAESASASIYGVSKAAFADKYADNAIVRGYLDRVLVLDRAGMTVVPHCQNYVSPYEVSYADGTITVTPKDGGIEESDIATFLIDGVAYTGGWSKSGETLVAPFRNEFTVTFSVQGESTSETYAYGETPAYTGSTDFKASDNLNYRIVGWDKAFTPVTGDVTYTAETLRRYELRWKDKSGAVTYQYNCLEGQIPVPPAGLTDDVISASTVSRFTGWDKELTALPSDHSKNFILYTAQYTDEVRRYDVSLTVDGAPAGTISVPYGETPAPKASDVPSKSGYNDVVWLSGTDTAVSGEGHSCVGYYSVYVGEQLLWSYKQSDLSFDPTGKNDNRGSVFEESTGLLYLLLEIRNAPADSAFAELALEKVIQSYKYFLSDAGCMAFFSLEPYWCYVPLTASTTVAKETPSVWNELTALEKEKLDFMMKCFAYILTLGNSDGNSYKSGPGFRGNFHKSWNPNYRLANVIPMLFVGRYFGGADEVDELLLAFNYDATVAKFTEYGWARATKEWTATPPTYDDVQAPSQKETMENGGSTFFVSGDSKTESSGVGVRTAFTYSGDRVDDVAGILETLFTYNYSGGKVVSTYNCIEGETIVPAYILDETKSPYEGEDGMMLELGKPNRSSCTYASDDFVIVCSALAALGELDMYDLETDGESILRMVWVGNMDFLYKIAHGYQSYATSGTPHSKPTYETERMGQFLWRSWWEGKYGHYTLETLPTGSTDVSDPVIYESDFSEFPTFSTTSSGGAYDDNLKPGLAPASGSTLSNAYAKVEKAGDNYYLACGVGEGGHGGLNFNLTHLQGLGSIGDATKLRISFKLAVPDGASGFASTLRLRSSAEKITLLSTTTSKKVTVGGVTIATLSSSFTEIALELDLVSGVLVAYVNGVEKTTTTLTSSSCDSLLAFSKTATSYIFNWYHTAATMGEGATCAHHFDDLRFEAISDVEEDDSTES